MQVIHRLSYAVHTYRQAVPPQVRLTSLIEIVGVEGESFTLDISLVNSWPAFRTILANCFPQSLKRRITDGCFMLSSCNADETRMLPWAFRLCFKDRKGFSINTSAILAAVYTPVYQSIQYDDLLKPGRRYDLALVPMVPGSGMLSAWHCFSFYFPQASHKLRSTASRFIYEVSSHLRHTIRCDDFEQRSWFLPSTTPGYGDEDMKSIIQRGRPETNGVTKPTHRPPIFKRSLASPSPRPYQRSFRHVSTATTPNTPRHSHQPNTRITAPNSTSNPSSTSTPSSTPPDPPHPPNPAPQPPQTNSPASTPPTDTALEPDSSPPPPDQCSAPHASP